MAISRVKNALVSKTRMLTPQRHDDVVRFHTHRSTSFGGIKKIVRGYSGIGRTHGSPAASALPLCACVAYYLAEL